MIDQKLLKRYLSGDVSQEEKEKVQLWLDDEKNMDEYMAWRTLYDITLANYEQEEKPENTSITKRKKLNILYSVSRIAAVVILTFGLSYLFFKNTDLLTPIRETVMQALYVPPGQRAEISLADSTVAWLNAQSRLTFPTKFTDKTREVFLDGEAYFDVFHDESQKFIVNTHFYKIVVLGTEFDVVAYSKTNYFETSLINGSIEIISKKDSERLILNPGETAYMKNNKLERRPITHYDHFLWKKGIISFDHERIEDILNKLSIYYDIEIQNSNESIKDLRYTGKFHTKDGILHVMNVLKIITGINFEKDNEKNLIVIN